MAENIQGFDAGNLKLNPTEMGVEARAGTARRIGAFSNQLAGATEMLARETQRLGSETAKLGSETAALGSFKAQAYGDVGRRLGSSISDAGDAAVKYLDAQQISHGAATWANLTAGLTQKWNDTVKTADPNDPGVSQRFMESLEPELAKFKEDGFYTEKGQQWAEAHVEALRQHMVEKTSADMATLAGQAAVVNQRQAINSLSSTVRGDPSSLDFSLAALKSSTEGILSSSPNMSGTAAAAARTEILQKGSESIVKSAAMGYIEKTGKVPPWATDPKYSPYINGEELKQFSQASRYYQRLGEAESRAARQNADYEAKKDFNTKIDKLEASTMPTQAGARPQLPQNYWDTLRELAQHPGAAIEPGRLKSMVEAGERLTDRLNKPEPIGPVSHQTTIELLNKIRATDTSRLTSNDDIYKAYGDGKLNTADFNFLQKEFQDRKTPEGAALNADRTLFFKQYAGALSGGMYDPQQGNPKLYAAEMAARRQENDLKRRNLDPHLVYDPTSEYYFGKPANVAKYAGSLQGDLQNKVEAASSAPKDISEPAKPARPEVPYDLRGIADLSYSATRKMWRDNASNKLYDASGKEAK